MDKKVFIIQVSNNRWPIRTRKGILILDDIHLDNSYEAEEYIKVYISSYHGWSYEVQPILVGGTNARR